MPKFGELLDTALRSGVTVSAADRGSGIRMLNMGELFRFPRVPDVEMARVDVDVSNQRNLLRSGDLIFARRSLTLEGAGKCSIIEEIGEPTTWESSIIRARMNPQVADPRFYFYFFRSLYGRCLMESIVEQVAAAGIRLTELRELEVPSPALAVQRAIAEVLGALDDKIAANASVAESADLLVRARFEEMARNADDRAALGSLADNPRDLIEPASCPVGTAYVGLEHIPRHRMWLSEWGSAAVVTSTKSKFSEGDVLFGKLRPYFHKVIGASTSGVCSTDVLVVRALPEVSQGYLLAALASDDVVQASTAASEGTRMPRTSWKDLSAVNVPWPGRARAVEFGFFVEALQARVHAAIMESRKLADTRDTLLPLLMSGRLRVRDAEREAEAAGL